MIRFNYKDILLFLILSFFAVIFLQNKFKFVDVEKLSGAIVNSENAYISKDSWFSGDYQIQTEKFINETFGFRDLFVRINNQIAYSFFNKAKANGVIIGKDNYLFEENYIKAYYGLDFIGADSIAIRMKKLKFIQDTLAKLNKNIIVVYAAGKGSFYPEYFPDKYKTVKERTNYECYTEMSQELGINHIDFNNFFVANKRKSKYPLYPKCGIHWSYYGMCLAADSMVRYMEKLRNIDMPNIFWTDIKMDDANGCDYDIGRGMNLKFKIKTEKMAYPNFQIESDKGKIKPSVLIVSDSFYWEMFNNGMSNAFTNSHFWFYNREIYPDSYEKPKETSQVNLKEEIANHDVIVIMATEATLPKLGWGFIEKTYDMFKGKSSK